MKKPICIFCIADKNNLAYARAMINSFRKFNNWDVILFTDETNTDNLPKNVIIRDLKPYLRDPMFFYRATPIIGEELLDEYDCVVKMDADQLVLGDMSYIEKTRDYDLATVINWNRWDERVYPLVQGWGIFPAEYFNCGLVAMRSKVAVHHWRTLCFSSQFDRLQYKEQDLLNAICYFGNYNIRCLDHTDPIKGVAAWWGMIAKGELNRAIIKENKVIVPKGFGDTPFPPTDMELKVIHLGGGKDAKKDNWGIYFSPEVMKYINKLTV